MSELHKNSNDLTLERGDVLNVRGKFLLREADLEIIVNDIRKTNPMGEGQIDLTVSDYRNGTYQRNVSIGASGKTSWTGSSYVTGGFKIGAFIITGEDGNQKAKVRISYTNNYKLL